MNDEQNNFGGNLDPNQRLDRLIEAGTQVRVDPHWQVKNYFRAGSDIHRQAQVYLVEGDLENAFILFMRFLTLFLDKIKNHLHINEISDDSRKANKAKLLEAMTVTEDLKKRILAVFESEYQQSQTDKENTTAAVDEVVKNNNNGLRNIKDAGDESFSPKPVSQPRQVFFDEPKREENRIQRLKEDLSADENESTERRPNNSIQ